MTLPKSSNLLQNCNLTCDSDKFDQSHIVVIYRLSRCATQVSPKILQGLQNLENCPCVQLYGDGRAICGGYTDYVLTLRQLCVDDLGGPPGRESVGCTTLDSARTC